MKRSASALSKATGAVIRGRYRKVGKSQQDIVDATGITITTVQRLVAGAAEIDMDQLGLIATFLGTSATDILREAERDLAEMSDASHKTDDLDTKRKQNEARAMTVEQIEALPHAATRDPEMDTDEPD